MLKEKFKENLRFRFLSIMFVILFVGTITISIVIAVNENKALKNSLATTGESFASYIAKLSKDPLVIKDSIQLDAIVNDVNKDENIAYALIRDDRGTPLTSEYASINYRQSRLNAVLLKLPGDSELQNIIDAIKKNESIIEVSIPIEIGMKIIGTVTVGMSEHKVRQEIVKNIVFVIALNLAMAFVLGAVLFVASKKMIFDPLLEIASASSRLARGNLSTVVNIGTTGEVKVVVDSFNDMVKNLEKVTVSKDYVDNIIASMINMLIVVSPDDKIIRVNDAACSLLGYEEEELIGQPVETIFGGARSREDSWKKSMLADDYIGNIEEVFSKKGGREVAVLLSVSVMRDVDNLTMGTVYVAQDITDYKRAEEALRESEEKYRNILETIEDGYVETNIAGNLSFFNPATCRMLGYSPDELKGMDYRKLMDETAARSLKQVFENVYQTGEAVEHTEYELIRKDGRKVYVESSISLIKDAKGASTGFRGIARDITMRKQAYEALQESEQKLHSIMQGSPIPAFVINKDHKILYWNRALSEVTGLKREDMVGTAGQWRAFYSMERPCMADIIVDEEFTLIPQFYSGKYIKSELLEDAYEAIDFFPNIGKDGKWLRLTAAAIRSSNGGLVGAIETMEDITKRKYAEEQVQQLNAELEHRIEERTAQLTRAYDRLKVEVAERARVEELYKVLAESSLAGVYVVQDNKFRFINSNAASYAGYMREELIDQEAALVVHPEDREMVKRNARAMLNGERISPYEFRIITKHGETRWIMETVASISYDDKPAVLGNSMDITDKKKASLQLLQSEKMASIGQLAAGVAHEINNPTAFVSSNLKTLAEYVDDIVKLINKYRILSADLKKAATVESLREMLSERLTLIEDMEEKTNTDFIVGDIVALIGESREGMGRIGMIVQDLKNFAHPGDEKIKAVNIKNSIESTLNIVWNELK
ncbi:MAG TPA: PAS domain S-box protein, partial [Syntrophales bacterium]|nr:PAS domain S-box protein [Syntrophales bacterium]